MWALSSELAAGSAQEAVHESFVLQLGRSRMVVVAAAHDKVEAPACRSVGCMAKAQAGACELSAAARAVEHG